MKIALFDGTSGASGDMTVGAFLDAGLPLKDLQRALKTLPLKGYQLKVRRVRRGAFSARQFCAEVSKTVVHHSVTFRQIQSLLRRSGLSQPVKRLSEELFFNLGCAEAKVHGTTLQKVHFHEVGAVDSILDLVSVAWAWHELGLQRAWAQNLCVGTGHGPFSHGHTPFPAPAALELLKGFPIQFVDVNHEMITPTGAAILATLCSKKEPIPPVEVVKVGYGAGQAVLAGRPNVLRLTLAETVEKGKLAERLVVAETNIDDLNPQAYEVVFEKLFAAGALDVWLTPILMKKGRPAQKLSVLFREPLRSDITRILFTETTTFGIRFMDVDRVALERKNVRVKLPWGTVAVKVGFLDGRPITAGPEYEDCKRLAQAKRIPFKQIHTVAQEMARKAFTGKN